MGEDGGGEDLRTKDKGQQIPFCLLVSFISALGMKGPHRNVKFRHNETDIFPLNSASSPLPFKQVTKGKFRTNQMEKGKCWQTPTQDEGG